MPLDRSWDRKNRRFPQEAGHESARLPLGPLRLGIIGMAAFLTVIDMTIPAFSSYFVNHTIVSGAVMSLLFLAIGYSVVEWSIRDAEQRRWDRVKRIGLIAVGRGVLNQRRSMQYCVIPTGKHCDGDFSPHEGYERVEAAIRSNLELIAGRGHDLLRSDAASTVQIQSGPQDATTIDQEMDFEERLRHLVRDEAWRKSAYHLLREAEHSMTRLIARWTPALSASQSGIDVLNCLSEQTDRFDNLIRRLDRWEVQASQTGAPLEKVWIAEQINALAIHERLMTLAKQEVYHSSARKLVPNDWKTYLTELSDRDPMPMRLVVANDGSVTKSSMLL